MIKKFKDWFKSKPPVDTTTKFNLSEFRSDSKDLLSYILDDSSIVLTIDTYSHDYKVNLMVVKDYDSDFEQELDEQINGYKVINFYDIKDDFVSYFTYIHSKYKHSRLDEGAPCAPQFEEVSEFFIGNGSTTRYANQFMRYYEGLGWRTKSGSPIINWKPIALNWIDREREKQQTDGSDFPRL